MNTEISQRLIGLIQLAIKIRETTEIAIDIHLSLSFWHVEFIFYPNPKDITYTHIESANLDSYYADEELDIISDLLESLTINPQQSIFINNQLN